MNVFRITASLILIAACFVIRELMNIEARKVDRILQESSTNYATFVHLGSGMRLLNALAYYSSSNSDWSLTIDRSFTPTLPTHTPTTSG